MSMRALSVLFVWLFATTAMAQSPQAGDVVFHRSRSAQSRIIQQVTSSPWTHVGVVFEREGALQVLEAVQPVRWTPLEDWVRRGRGGDLRLEAKGLKYV